MRKENAVIILNYFNEHTQMLIFTQHKWTNVMDMHFLVFQGIFSCAKISIEVIFNHAEFSSFQHPVCHNL